MEIAIIQFDQQHIKIEITMQSGVEKLDVMGLLKIDESNINKDIVEQSSWFCFFSTILAQLESATERAKMKLSVLEAEMDQKLRLKAVEEKTKATEGSIEKAIEASKEHIATKTAFLDCKEREGIFRGFVEAFAQRGAMLKALAGRMQYEKDLSVLQKNL